MSGCKFRLIPSKMRSKKKFKKTAEYKDNGDWIGIRNKSSYIWTIFAFILLFPLTATLSWIGELSELINTRESYWEEITQKNSNTSKKEKKND